MGDILLGAVVVAMVIFVIVVIITTLGDDQLSYEIIEIEGMPCVYVSSYSALTCDWSKYDRGAK